MSDAMSEWVEDDGDQVEDDVRLEEWERHPEESAKGFQAFATFRDMGAARSLSAVADELIRKAPERQKATVVSQLKAWSAKHDWLGRAALYDAHLDRRDRAEAEADRSAMRRRHSQASALISEKLIQRLTDDPPEGVEPVDVNGLNFDQLVRALDRAQAMETRANPAGLKYLPPGTDVPVPAVLRMLEGMYDIISRHVPAERLPRAAAEVQQLLADL